MKIQTTCETCGKDFSYIVCRKPNKPRALCEECKKKKKKYGEVLAVKEEIKKKRGFEGLWKGRSGWYRSKAFMKKDIENLLAGEKGRKCIILRYNKYHKDSDDGRPNFIFAFADAREDFMHTVYCELSDDADNCRANRIIDAADEYTDSF